MEEFFKLHQHTISAFGTASTFLAVFVSLYLANHKPKGKNIYANLQLRKQSYEEAELEELFLCVQITNFDSTSIVVHKNFIRLFGASVDPVDCNFSSDLVSPGEYLEKGYTAFNGEHRIWNPLYSGSEGKLVKDYPVVLETGHSETFFIDVFDSLTSFFIEEFERNKIINLLTFGLLLSNPFQIVVSGSITPKIKLSKELKVELKKLIKGGVQ